jgi:tyrosine-protein kinase
MAMSNDVGNGPRYVTLKDYVRVIRANRVLIAVIVLAFTTATYLYFDRQTPTYVAEAALAFKDPLRDLELIGATPPNPAQTDEQRAAINAELVTDLPVAKRVRRALDSNLSAAQLQSMVSAATESKTNLVVVVGRSSDPELAARVANEFARQARAAAQRRAQRRLEAAARIFRRQLRRDRGTRPPTGDRQFFRAVAEDRLAELRALSDYGNAAEIARRARTPGQPVSPKVARNTIFGALLGATLALLAAFSRDALDRRMRAPRQVQEELDLPVLGEISSEALAAASVNGARGQVPAQDLEAVHILRANVDFLDPGREIRTIAVTSAVAEEGKSTVAVGLARANAAAGRRTILIECDLRRPSLAGRLSVRARPGLSEFLANRAGADEIFRTVPVDRASRNGRGNGPDSPGFTCVVAGGDDDRPAERLGRAEFRDFLAVVARSYDAVILDCTPLLPVVDALTVVPLVDAVLLCVRASHTSREQAKAAKAALERFPPRPTGLVVTGMQATELASYAYEYPR